MNLDQLLRAVAQSSLCVVTAPTAGYLALQVLRALREPTRRASPETILLMPDGRVAVRGALSCAAGELELFVRELLSSLLAGVATAPPAFRRISDSAGGKGLQCLEAELLSALIPINGAASRRALARLRRSCCDLVRDAETKTTTELGFAIAPSSRSESSDPVAPPSPPAVNPRPRQPTSGATSHSGLPPVAPVDARTRRPDISKAIAAVASPPLRSSPLPAPGDHVLEASCGPLFDVATGPKPHDLCLPEAPPRERSAVAVPALKRSQASELARRFLAREQSADRIAQRLRLLAGVDPAPLDVSAEASPD